MLFAPFGKLWNKEPPLPTYEALKRRAEKLLKEGDALGGQTAAGKRKLRACRRLRLKALCTLNRKK